MTLALSAAFAVLYPVAQRCAVGVPWDPPEMGLDRVIAFDGRWVWVYQSVYVPFMLAPWLITDRRRLARYAAGFLVILAVAFGVFMLAPSLGPPRDPARFEGLYGVVCGMDTRGNAFPSLHAALIVYTIVWAGRARVGQGLMVGFIVWGGLTLFSTLAIKQHYAIDLVAGALLGVVVDWACGLRAAGESQRGRRR
jgi:membrane-associated phospholipid phosphatase